MQIATAQPIITIENRLTLAQAGKLIGKSPSCIFRWIASGSAGVRLEHAYYGSQLFTSREAIERYAQRVAEAKATRRCAAVAPSPDRDLVSAGL